MQRTYSAQSSRTCASTAKSRQCQISQMEILTGKYPFRNMENKKVLLREHKRHTDRGVSTPTAALSGGVGTYLGGGGVYPPGWVSIYLGWGVPTLPRVGNPPVLTWLGGGTYLGWGRGPTLSQVGTPLVWTD